jgi:hypothetical protein
MSWLTCHDSRLHWYADNPFWHEYGRFKHEKISLFLYIIMSHFMNHDSWSFEKYWISNWYSQVLQIGFPRANTNFSSFEIKTRTFTTHFYPLWKLKFECAPHIGSVNMFFDIDEALIVNSGKRTCKSIDLLDAFASWYWTHRVITHNSSVSYNKIRSCTIHIIPWDKKSRLFVLLYS